VLLKKLGLQTLPFLNSHMKTKPMTKFFSTLSLMALILEPITSLGTIKNAQTAKPDINTATHISSTFSSEAKLDENPAKQFEGSVDTRNVGKTAEVEQEDRLDPMIGLGIGDGIKDARYNHEVEKATKKVQEVRKESEEYKNVQEDKNKMTP
jgi:triosephosphate isomerase